MATAVLIPVSEYLGQTYDPDREYIEGILQERNAGEINHSDAQSALNAYIRFEFAGFWCGVEACIQVKADCYRIPGVICV